MEAGTSRYSANSIENSPRPCVAPLRADEYANICAIGNLLIDDLGLGQDVWPDIGAEDLLEPYEVTCSPDAFPIEEATRLQNLYVVSFFKRHLLDQKGYDQYLTTDYADGEPAITFSVK